MTEATETNKLVYMANQIAAFFNAYPQQEAVEGIRTHLVSFWTPRMRADLRTHAADPALSPLVRLVLPGLM
jgi:formate dehydrogenase subunit delta